MDHDAVSDQVTLIQHINVEEGQAAERHGVALPTPELRFAKETPLGLQVQTHVPDDDDHDGYDGRV